MDSIHIVGGQAARGENPDFGGEERRADPAALRATDRRGTGARQSAAARRRRQLRPFAQPAWRVDQDRRGQEGRDRAADDAERARDRLDRRALRHGPQDARVDPRARPDAGPRRRSDRLPARRLRDRRPADRPAFASPRSDRRRDRAHRRLCEGDRAQGPLAGRRLQLPGGVGRRDRECADGGGAGDRPHPIVQRRARARDRRSLQSAGGDGRQDQGDRLGPPDHQRRRGAPRRDLRRDARPDRGGKLCLRGGDHRRLDRSGRRQARRHAGDHATRCPRPD